MIVTNKQIEKVCVYLKNNGLGDYVDIKNELLDHLISDIECQVIDKKYTFDYAFAKTKQKWKGQFKKTYSSYHFGIFSHAPKIIIDRAKSVVKFVELYLFLGYLFLFLMSKLIVFNFSVIGEMYLNYMLNTGILFSLIIYVYVKIKMKRTKMKSAYSFIIVARKTPILFFIGTLFFEQAIDSKGHITSSFILSCYAFMYIVYTFFMYKKHIQNIKIHANYFDNYKKVTK